MGLFKCPDCEANISDRGYACPHCGCPVNKETIAESKAKEKKRLDQEMKKLERKLAREKLLNDANEQLANSIDAIRKKLIKDKKYISIPNDDVKYKTIAKILNSNRNLKPLLSCFTPVEGGVLFTDSYHLFVLNDKYLPFNVAFNVQYSKTKQKNYINRYNLKKVDGDYPVTMSIIPTYRPIDSVKIDLNEFLLEYYTRDRVLKDKECKKLLKIQESNNAISFNMIMTLKTRCGKIGYNAKYVKNAIDILKLDGDFYIDVYGLNKPMIIKNKDEEIALIAPVIFH